jgi:hypothetical protein
MLQKLNENGYLEHKAIVGQSENGRNKWANIAWQKPVFPLIDDNIYKVDIQNYWKDKPVKFADYNNCVGCFHRNPPFLRFMFQEHPTKMEWFARQEGGKNGYWKSIDGQVIPYARIKNIMQQTVVEQDPLKKSLFTEKLDKILLHQRWGYLILLLVLFVLFQSVFWIAQYPMSGIEWVFGQLGSWFTEVLPAGWFADLFINGFLSGISGIMVFIPQIMILFGLITLLEDTGYMARISFFSAQISIKSSIFMFLYFAAKV